MRLDLPPKRLVASLRGSKRLYYFALDERLTGLIGNIKLTDTGDVVFKIAKPVPEFAKTNEISKNGEINLGKPTSNYSLYWTEHSVLINNKHGWPHNGVGEGTDPQTIQDILLALKDSTTEEAKYRAALSVYWQELDETSTKHGLYTKEANAVSKPNPKDFELTSETIRLIQEPFDRYWDWIQSTGYQTAKNWAYTIGPNVMPGRRPS